jgi:hypothetical protein
MLGYLNGISFLGYDFQSYPNSQKTSLNILTYPNISYHIPTYHSESPSSASSSLAAAAKAADTAIKRAVADAVAGESGRIEPLLLGLGRPGVNGV